MWTSVANLVTEVDAEDSEGEDNELVIEQEFSLSDVSDNSDQTL